MKKIKNPYWGIFKMEFIGELQYRTKVISGAITQFFWGLLYIFLYQALYKTGNAPSGFSLEQMATYVWLGQAFLIIRIVNIPQILMNEIKNGNICYKFIRPIDLYNHWFITISGKKTAEVLLRSGLIIIIAFLLPKGFCINAPVSIWALLLSILSLALGAIINFAIDEFVLYLTFKTMEPKSAKTIVATIVSLFGGILIPIPLFPQKVQEVLNFLPFRYISDLSFRIYCGNISLKESLIFIPIQIIWIVLLIALGKLLIKRTTKNVEIQGG